MASFNKQFEYKGYKFNINVTTNTKKLCSTNYHTITLNDLGSSSFFVIDDCTYASLENNLKVIEGRAKTYVDAKETEDDKLANKLNGLGFKR
jgi:hypothetical protein